jgi:hypothetical protein
MIKRLKFDLEELVDTMINQLPKEVFESDSTTFFDPSIAGGQFVKAVEERLRKYGHSDSNISKRVFGLIENNLRLNYIMNTHKLVGSYNVGDFLKKDFNNMKFDVVIGNPPYTQGVSKTTLYNKFTYLGTELLNDTGKLVFVVPMAWYFSSNSTNKKYRTFLQNNNLSYVKELPKDTFDATVATTYFVLDKEYNNDNGILVEPLNGSAFTISNDGVIFTSQILASIVNKTQSKENKYKFTSVYNKVKEVEEVTRLVKVSNNKGIEETESNLVSPNSEKYRLITGYMRNSYYHIDSIHIAEPGLNIKNGYVQMICDSKEKAENIKSVLHSKLSKFLFDSTRTSRSLDSAQLNFIPYLDDKVYTDSELYSKFNLTQEEIDLIESTLS